MPLSRRLSVCLLPVLSALAWTTAAVAQGQPSAYTTGFRWDLERRLTGMIGPDPGGAGPLPFIAERYSYNGEGQLVAIERGTLGAWQADTVAPSGWSGFTIRETQSFAYDAAGNSVEDRLTAAGTVHRVTQVTHDLDDRPGCRAVRMNLAAVPAAGSNACALGTTGSFGPDRITSYIYDNADQLLQERRAEGTPLEQAYITQTYSPNGQRLTLADARNNLATFVYDGFDRQAAWRFPTKANGTVSAPCTIGTIAEVGGVAGPSESRGTSDDCEKYAWDRNGNRATLMKRDGQLIRYSHDAVNRMTVKDVPGGTTADVFYAYDLRGLQLSALFASTAGEGVSSAFDKAGRQLSSTITLGGVSRQLQYLWDANSNRIRVTHPDGNYFTTDYDGLNRATVIQGASAIIATIAYEAQGRRTSLSGGTVTSYAYDAASRLSSLTHNLLGTGFDVTFAFESYNPASQLVTREISNTAYAPVRSAVSRSYTVNGLNQYTAAGGAVIAHDLNSNMTSDGATTFAYDVENRLTSASGAKNATLSYDPLGRLWRMVAGTATTTFVYGPGANVAGGEELVAEYDGGTALLRRFIHGPGVDELLTWYDGAVVVSTYRRDVRADHQGSIVVVANGSGTGIATNSYDEWGNPDAGNLGRFQYTGQAWLTQLGLYHYKARFYSPTLGRFLQTDPIGYDDQINLYAYVGNDPVNGRDPTGESCEREDGGICGFARDVLIGDIEDAVANPSATSIAIAVVTTVFKPAKVLDKAIDGIQAIKKVEKAADKLPPLKASTPIGTRVRTPDNSPKDFKPLRGSQGQVDKKTGTIFQRSHSNHSQSPNGEFKAGARPGQPPTKGNKDTIEAGEAGGCLIKRDRC